MNRNELTTEHINKLFLFVKSKYVNFIDVQHELVDHLACDIEELQTKDVNITFDQALHKVYDKYPITGFSNLKDAKIKAMNKYWLRIYWEYIKSYFTLPKIIISIGLGWTYFKLFSLFGSKSIILFFIIGMAVSIYHSVWLIKKFKVKNNKNYLVINSFIGLFGSSNFTSIVIGATLGDGINFGNYNPHVIIFISIIAAYMTIIFPALFHNFPDRLEADIEKKYPYISSIA